MMTSNPAKLIYRLDNAFWRFSITAYQNDDVKKMCLSFQNTHELNVNILLFCCWLAFTLEEISQQELLQASHSIMHWHDSVTQSLRKTRLWLKSQPASVAWIDDFHQQVLMNELASETYQQSLLYSYFKHKEQTHSRNEEQAINYLYWIFNDRNLVIDPRLEIQTKQFVQLISLVTPHEKATSNHRN